MLNTTDLRYEIGCNQYNYLYFALEYKANMQNIHTKHTIHLKNIVYYRWLATKSTVHLGYRNCKGSAEGLNFLTA